MDTVNPITPQEIRARRKAARLTQHAFGARIGVGGTEISRWERGKHKPHPIMAAKIREMFPDDEEEAVEVIGSNLDRIANAVNRVLDVCVVHPEIPESVKAGMMMIKASVTDAAKALYGKADDSSERGQP